MVVFTLAQIPRCWCPHGYIEITTALRAVKGVGSENFYACRLSFPRASLRQGRLGYGGMYEFSRCKYLSVVLAACCGFLRHVFLASGWSASRGVGFFGDPAAFLGCDKPPLPQKATIDSLNPAIYAIRSRERTSVIHTYI